MNAAPKEIKAKDGQIKILWSDGHQSGYAGRDLRLACRCAACIDEWTHETLVQSPAVPADVRPLRIETVGNYALHISWSDGHNTGIYTYDQLRLLCGCDECKQGRSFDV